MRETTASKSPFINRHTSWLEFNTRVLEEAEDLSNPLLERLKYLSISASNLDEFFEVHVAGLLQRIEDDDAAPSLEGLSPQQQIDILSVRTHDFVKRQNDVWVEDLLPSLAAQGIRVKSFDDLDDAANDYLTDYYRRDVDPLLTPITIDPAHPFPRVLNKALCIAISLRRKRRASQIYLGVVTVPRALPRVIRIPSPEGAYEFVTLADLIMKYAASMYRGYDILASMPFRVTRNSNLYLAEEETRSLLESVRSELHNRRKGDAVRLEVSSDAPEDLVQRLRTNFEVEEWQIFRTRGPVNLSRLFNIYEQVPRNDLKFSSFTARELHLTAKAQNIFDEIRQRDILLHHPFDSYDAVVKFVASAAQDPAVVSIKQTLYRTSSDSPIFQALIEAAASKEVTAVVELKARFDEASNIRWARNLEDAGVQVFHGLVGLKTHCKCSLIVRRDHDGVTRRYAHLGTGNYNPVTASFYTDFSLLTADPQITAAVQEVFSFLTAYTERSSYSPLMVAPVDLARKVLQLINREAEHAAAGRPARIIGKMNSLLDKEVVEALYRASNAGVHTDLIVRGICSLRPGVRGLSSRIHVRSIVGRLLEHSRIYYFENGGDPEIFAGSADWMTRNLHERCEVAFPINDPLLQQRIRFEVLEAYLQDTAKARILQSDGSYKRPVRFPRRATSSRNKLFNAQEFLIQVAENKATPADIPGHKSNGQIAKSITTNSSKNPARKRVPRRIVAAVNDRAVNE
jgi:polyphosphate kinase